MSKMLVLLLIIANGFCKMNQSTSLDASLQWSSQASAKARSLYYVLSITSLTTTPRESESCAKDPFE